VNERGRMIGDLVIICLGIASVWSAYKLFTMQTEYTAFTFGLGLFLISFVIGGILAPNSNLLNEFLTPEINGVLIDAESNKPLPNVDVVIGWEGESYVFMSTVHNYLKSINIKTDSSGRFHAPKHYKSLALRAPFFERKNSDSSISIFNLDFNILKAVNTGKYKTFYMKKITDYQMLKEKYRYLQTLKDVGNDKEKAIAAAYLDKFKQHRNEYIKMFHIPTDELFWIGVR
jgi:hypothetical protein